MKFNIESRVLLMNSFTWIFMSIISFVAYQNLQSMKETSVWVNHTHQVIGNASKIEKLVLDMETSERGFLIVGKNDFLVPYENGKQSLSKLIDETEDLVSDNPQQINNIGKIKRLIEQWQVEAAAPEIQKRREVTTQNATMEEVVALIEKRTGKTIMDEMRDEFLNFKKIENELMVERQSKANAEISFTEYMIIIGTLAIILFSHIFSLLLSDAIKKPIELLRSTITGIGFGIVPSKTQIESNRFFFGLEESFEKIATAQKLTKE